MRDVLCVIGCGRPVELLADGRPGVLCTPCILGDVEGPTYRVSDPLLTKAEDPWYIGGNHLPAKQQRPDPTRQDRAA